MTPEQLERTAAAIALTVGVGAALAPRQLVRAYGMDGDQMTGVAAFGWRLFAMRNVGVGLAGLLGNRTARDFTTLLQPPDQLVFLHGMRSGEIPRHTGLMAMTTSALVFAAGVLAKVKRG